MYVNFRCAGLTRGVLNYQSRYDVSVSVDDSNFNSGILIKQISHIWSTVFSKITSQVNHSDVYFHASLYLGIHPLVSTCTFPVYVLIDLSPLAIFICIRLLPRVAFVKGTAWLM